MTVKGRVAEIIFNNEENGYTVLNFETDGDFFTAVGIFPPVNVGEYFVLTGNFKRNSRFGEQFVVTEAEISSPDDIEGIIGYLSCGLLKGVGEKTARRIVDCFGEETLDILENHPERLRQVSGIGKAKLKDIVDSYRETKHMKESICFLQKFDITTALALKIYRNYGDGTVSVINNNPYRLIEDIGGIGFLTADRIAEKNGIEKDSRFRLKAGIIHVLNEAAEKNGHTCLPENVLLDTATRLLEVDKELIAETLNDLYNVKRIILGGVKFVAADLNYRTEDAIATKLLLLKKFADKWDIDVDNELEVFGSAHGMTLHRNQKDAIKSVFGNGVTVITGGPGTGKTTIIRAITEIAGRRGKKVILCAPTGRASKRMTEMTGVESRTIHRLLGVDFTAENKFEKNENNLLTADIVIVDEISMADIFIFHALLKAIARGTRLVLVGDKDQLPSVSCGNILSDIISSGAINVVFLTEIYRQSEKSFITLNAHRINDGNLPLPDNKYDFFISNKTDPADVVDTVISMLKTRIPKFAGVSQNDIQVLAPIKKGLVGVENLNEKIQEAVNPSGKSYLRGKTVFKVGDKVMQNCNNYTVEWTKQDGERGCGVFNGDIGIIESLEKDGVTVIFDDGKRVAYSEGNLDDLMLAYCVSVHKSQGSEFPVVILALSGSNPMLLTRNLLYTAVTRAKKMVVIVGDFNCVKRMVGNNYTAERYSLLRNFLMNNQAKVDMLWGE